MVERNIFIFITCNLSYFLLAFFLILGLNIITRHRGNVYTYFRILIGRRNVIDKISDIIRTFLSR